MYIDFGNNAVIRDSDIIGIFDLDTSTVSKKTRDYINSAEKNGETVTVALYELPKSFTVTAKKGEKQKIIISPLSAATAALRCKKSPKRDIFGI